VPATVCPRDCDGPVGGGAGVSPATGATPSIVPLSLLGTDGNTAPGNGSPGRGAGARGGGALGETAGWFIISMVPLNFGAATLLR
jgi:hypothetical protein